MSAAAAPYKASGSGAGFFQQAGTGSVESVETTSTID